MAREPPDLAALDVRRVDLRLEAPPDERVVRIRLAVRREGEPLAVGREARLTMVPVAFGDVRDARAVGRPPDVGALDERARTGAIGVHDPDRGLPAVVHFVDPAA